MNETIEEYRERTRMKKFTDLTENEQRRLHSKFKDKNRRQHKMWSLLLDKSAKLSKQEEEPSND